MGTPGAKQSHHLVTPKAKSLPTSPLAYEVPNPPHFYLALLILGVSRQQRVVRGGQNKPLFLYRQLPDWTPTAVTKTRSPALCPLTSPLNLSKAANC